MTSALFAGAGLGLLVPLVQGFTEPSAPPFETGITWFDVWFLGTEASAANRLYRISALILTSVWLQAGLSYLSSRKIIKLREIILDRLRRQAVDQLQSVSLSFFSEKRSGEFINILTSQISRLRHLFGTANQFLSVSFEIVVYTAAIFWLSWELALFALLFSGILFGMLKRILARLRAGSDEMYESDRELTSRITELINGIRTITVFGTRDYEAKRFRKASRRNAETKTETEQRGTIVGPVTKFVSSTGLVVLIVIAARFFILSGSLSPAVLLTFFFALSRLFPLIQQINNARSQWAISQSALNAVADLLNQDDKPYLSDGWRTFTQFNDALELEHVDFSYEPGQPVLHDVSLRLEQGQTLAIVGASGAGKSTLADVVARLYDPDSGRVLLDGYDIREYKIDSLRNKIVIVSQSTFLFADTIRENIAYGLEDVPDEKVYWAADKANALTFIEDMPNGLDSQLGDRGENFSGGQRQRIAIARALLRDPEILILDEATSALDSVTERKVQESLDYLMEGRTVIVIAHRLSTLENADQVIVLEEGRIVERGGYQELLDREGQLWEYHKVQFQIA